MTIIVLIRKTLIICVLIIVEQKKNETHVVDTLPHCKIRTKLHSFKNTSLLFYFNNKEQHKYEKKQV
jgi:hypothetical protein